MTDARPLHPSLWSTTAPSAPDFPRAMDCEVDVAIVGGGLAGITAAYLLKRAGKRVAVLEMGRVGSGQTAATTAHLTWILDQPIAQLRKDFGDEGARAVLDAHAAAMDEIERIARTESIDCDFERVTAYRYGLKRGQKRALEHDARAASALGRACDYVAASETPLRCAHGGAVRAPGQGKFHPLKFLYGIATRIPGDRSHVFERSKVLESARSGGAWRVRTAQGATVTAAQLLVATNSPTGLVPTLQTRMEPYQTYALAAEIPAGTLPVGLYWDSEDPYQYTRVEHGSERDTVVLGGRDHKTGERQDPGRAHAQLEAYLQHELGVTDYTLTHRWSGQVLEPVDGVAYIGRWPGHADARFVATGFGGNGMTYSVIAAMLTRDLVLGQANPWESVFDPSRVKPAASAASFVRTNAHVALKLVTGYLAPAEVDSIDDVAPGEGRMVRVAGRKLAVYRDEHGGVTALSPVCPHMGCVVKWNGEEKTWDCPCHGSRFDATGAVNTGPATSALAPVELGAHEAVTAK